MSNQKKKIKIRIQCPQSGRCWYSKILNMTDQEILELKDDLLHFPDGGFIVQEDVKSTIDLCLSADLLKTTINSIIYYD